MIISIASGKGGTGKTTVAVSLALSISHAELLDCDVEEPNTHLFLKHEVLEKKPVFLPVPEVDETVCSFCGRCSEICAYNAIAVLKTRVLIFSELCHSCDGCRLLCPEKAITMVEKEIGTVEIADAGKGLTLIEGRLKIGEARSSPLVKEVKALMKRDNNVIIDAPPGTACSMVESVRESDFCILVTEPTPFGLYDLNLAVQVLRKMEIPCGVVINRSGLGDERVDDYCREKNIPVLMKIPFSREIAGAYSQGIPLVREKPEYAERFRELFHTIERTFKEQKA
jgi:MinD superfamily P-loop ATPase